MRFESSKCIKIRLLPPRTPLGERSARPSGWIWEDGKKWERGGESKGKGKGWH